MNHCQRQIWIVWGHRSPRYNSVGLLYDLWVLITKECDVIPPTFLSLSPVLTVFTELHVEDDSAQEQVSQDVPSLPWDIIIKVTSGPEWAERMLSKYTTNYGFYILILRWKDKYKLQQQRILKGKTFNFLIGLNINKDWSFSSSDTSHEPRI